MVLKQFHPHVFLTDIYFRFLISFGYYQYHTRDANRIYGVSCNPSDEWAPVAVVMREKGQSIRFLFELGVVHGRMSAVPRRFPKWYDDFIPQHWNSHF